MSARHARKTSFERLLRHPANAPLVHVDRRHLLTLATPTAMPKREATGPPEQEASRTALTEGVNALDALETAWRVSGGDDIDMAAQQLNRAIRARSLLKAEVSEHAENLLLQLDRLIQSAMEAAKVAVRDWFHDRLVCFDIESTEPIPSSGSGRTIADMQPSVVCLLGVDVTLGLNDPEGAARRGEALTCWNHVVDGMPIELVLEAFDVARHITGFNVLRFDFEVLKRYYRGDEARFEAHRSKTIDTLLALKNASGRSFKLAQLLDANRALPPKLGDGLGAVRLWELQEYAALERYCTRDVLAELRLALLPEVELPTGATVDNPVRLSVARGAAAASGEASGQTAAQKRYPLPGDTRALTQGSPLWLNARKGLITASTAGAALGLPGAFLSRDAVCAMLHAQLNNLDEPEVEDLDTERRAAMQRGVQMEPIARAAYERLMSRRVEQSGLHLHPRLSTALAASPDGIVLRPNGELSDLMLEIKVPRENSRGAGLTDAYLCQLQLGMACTETQRADFAVLRTDRSGDGALQSTLSITRVDRDNALIDVLERQLVAFHASAHADDEPFPRDASEAAELRQALSASRQEQVGEEREFPSERFP